MLQEHIPGYGVLTYLRDHPQARIYQLGLEESLYYAPRPIWGDVFGPWRYRDYQSLSPQALRRRYLLWSALHLSVCLGAAYVALKLLLKA